MTLCVALADLVSNRFQRETPSCFKPRHYFPTLADSLVRSLVQHYSEAHARPPATSLVFRMVCEKLVRIGQTRALVESWLNSRHSALYDARAGATHRVLLQSLPESCHEHVLRELASVPVPSGVSIESDPFTVRSPKYRLISLLPEAVATNKQFQYVVAHKLLLQKPFDDLYFLRALVDVLVRADSPPGSETSDTTAATPPLSAIFDVVVNRWSQPDFVGTADYALNASVSFFLRYAFKRLAATSEFAQTDWVPKLCRGVQAHMSHSLERTRVLGMRVGESLSLVISPEHPLSFELPLADPLAVFGSDVFDGGGAAAVEGDDRAEKEMLAAGASGGRGGSSPTAVLGEAETTRRTQKKKKTKAAAFALDPDSVLDSDDDATSDKDDDDDDDDASDSDTSLDAYDLADDEQDLTAKRPLYLKDLIAGLQADDDREKVEAALAEAEALLRKKPRDVHDQATEVVTALLRLEDKFNTPHFETLRASALAAACTVAPVQVVPYFHRQALEREQLLQSRIDVLQALVAASQELAQVGAFRPSTQKTLLSEDLETRTTRELKTRRWGYRRDPLALPTRNAFSDHALAFFSPLLFGYVEYVRVHSSSSSSDSGLGEIESTFLAHLLHALGVFVECAGHAPQAVPMAKCLLEFAWRERASPVAAVRRQVLFSVSRALLVVPPFVLRQDLGEQVTALAGWLQRVARDDPDAGCREGSRLLLSSGMMPLLSLP